MNLLLTVYPTRALLANSSVMYHAFLDEESDALIADPAALGSKRCDVSCVYGKGRMVGELGNCHFLASKIACIFFP
jgi:hypothetical protein